MYRKLFLFLPLLFFCIGGVVHAQTPGPGDYELNDTLNGTNGGGDASVGEAGGLDIAVLSYTTNGGQTTHVVTVAYDGDDDLGTSTWSNGDDAGSTRWEVLEVDGVCYYWIKKKQRDGTWKTVSSGTLKKKKKKEDPQPID